MTMTDRSYKFLNIASAVILIIALGLVILSAYFLFIDGNPPITINAPITLDKEHYYAGESMLITGDICRNTTAGATLHPTFINVGTRQLFNAAPVYVDNLPTGCNISVMTVTVPHYLPAGTYIRQIRARYDVNFLTSRVVEFTTEEFEILERRKKD